MQEALQLWLEGADVKNIMIRVRSRHLSCNIWWNKNNRRNILTEDFTHFLNDLDIIQNSDASIKIVIVNSGILKDEKYIHHYDKIRIAELVKGYLVSRLLDGDKILKDPNYLKKIVKETALVLLCDLNARPDSITIKINIP